MKQDRFSEMTAREKARSVLDEGSDRELLDPFARLESPHLSVQDIVPQSDDGVVIARGKSVAEMRLWFRWRVPFREDPSAKSTGRKSPERLN